MAEFVGLPSTLFADEEIIGSRVRLVECVPLGFGQKLMAGETFVVRAVDRCQPAIRRLLVTNHRARSVPVAAELCELILPWGV